MQAIDATNLFGNFAPQQAVHEESRERQRSQEAERAQSVSLYPFSSSPWARSSEPRRLASNTTMAIATAISQAAAM